VPEHLPHDLPETDADDGDEPLNGSHAPHPAVEESRSATG
jgi:hypothetical protein